MKTIKLDLSGNSIDNLIDSLLKLDNDLRKASQDIVKDMVMFTEQQVNYNISATPYKAISETTEAYSEIKENNGIAGMRGPQSVYEEFGTGTEGSNSPHPKKEDFGLNPYNSGPSIRPANITIAAKTGILPGELYWTYIDENSGEFVYTQGIPAGKQVFDASIRLKDVKQSIINKRVGEAISKL